MRLIVGCSALLLLCSTLKTTKADETGLRDPGRVVTGLEPANAGSVRNAGNLGGGRPNLSLIGLVSGLLELILGSPSRQGRQTGGGDSDNLNRTSRQLGDLGTVLGGVGGAGGIQPIVGGDNSVVCGILDLLLGCGFGNCRNKSSSSGNSGSGGGGGNGPNTLIDLVNSLLQSLLGSNRGGNQNGGGRGGGSGSLIDLVNGLLQSLLGSSNGGNNNNYPNNGGNNNNYPNNGGNNHNYPNNGGNNGGNQSGRGCKKPCQGGECENCNKVITRLIELIERVIRTNQEPYPHRPSIPRPTAPIGLQPHVPYVPDYHTEQPYFGMI